MAKLKDIKIHRKWAIRRSDDVISSMRIWEVEEDEEYDMVQFSINELNKPYYWNVVFCLTVGLAEDYIREKIEKYVATITEEDIKKYRIFLEEGEIFGWD